MRHITSCSGQRVDCSPVSDDGPSSDTAPARNERAGNQTDARARPHKCLTHSLTQFTPLAAGCCSRPLVRNLRSHGMPHHETPVPGSRRTADGVPDGRIASPLPVWASHDRLSIAIGARGMPHRDLTRRLLPLPIIHATSSVSSVSSISSVPHNPCQTRFQWPRAAPAPCARLALQSPQADAARGAAPPPPLERLRVRATSRSVSSARLHARFRQFTLGFVSSSTRTPDSGLTHAPQP